MGLAQVALEASEQARCLTLPGAGKGREDSLEEVVPETQGQIGADLEEAGGGEEAERGPFYSETHPVCI